MSSNSHLVLVMGRGLEWSDDGTVRLDESSRRMVKAAARMWSTNPHLHFVFTAPVSPEFGGPPLGKLMADYFYELCSGNRVRVSQLMADSFDSRGELSVFAHWIRRQPFDRITIVAVHWHIPRIKVILRQEWDPEVIDCVDFESVDETWSWLAHAKEWSKRYVHVYLPPYVGRPLVKVLRTFGMRTSW